MSSFQLGLGNYSSSVVRGHTELALPDDMHQVSHVREASEILQGSSPGRVPQGLCK